MSTEASYSGKGVSCADLGGGLWEIIFDHQKSSVNKFDQVTLDDLETIIERLIKVPDLKGVLATSAKPAFIVGADVTEFPEYFKRSEQEMSSWLKKTHTVFSKFEDLPAPTVAAIGGLCLGGGCEFALAATFRVLSTKGVLGLPEVKLGLYPGWGGTVRLPRLIGTDNAVEWIATGSTQNAIAAQRVGAADVVVEPAELRRAGLDLLEKAYAGKIDWQERRKQKISPLAFISPLEKAMAFETAKAFVGAKAGPNYPAPILAIKAMEAASDLGRDEAAKIEIAGFIKAAKTEAAQCLVTIFLSDQYNKKKAKTLAKGVEEAKRVAVLGAGIMGGGIAYQSVSKGTQVLMKDINDEALMLGVGEASKLFTKQVERKKIKVGEMALGMAAITPTRSYGDFASVQVVVEAVIENEAIKTEVLAEVEGQVESSTVIASNTSTISITKLAQGLKRPENFCGLHFFNPVHRMPLVEVIKGEKTSDQTIARAVSYALQIGKTPIVVNDCPGFLVNRILFPYFFGFSSLLAEGVDFVRIDKVMERFGWPMGPAYLLDVIGIDTAYHAGEVMAAGFPDRMPAQEGTVIEAMVKNKRFGQKNGKGFFKYELDRKGRAKKMPDVAGAEIVAKAVNSNKEITDEAIIERMMIPMINESVRCLEEGIVATPMELDLGLIYGVGFPPFRGGAMKTLDHWGLSAFSKTANTLAAEYGAAYRTPQLLEQYIKDNRSFY